MTNNYHTHTRWCNHGTGEIEDYVRRALEGGLREIAITEHIPLIGDFDRRRILCSEFPAYNAELDRVVEKYKGQIRVRKGFECEYYPDQIDAYRRYRKDYGYEILILGQHMSRDRRFDNFSLTTPEGLEAYTNDVCEGLETGLFTFLAHPDVVMFGYKNYDEHAQKAMSCIFSLCTQKNIPVEINANGRNYGRGYPCRAVWADMKRYDPICIIGSDAHNVEDLLCGAVRECEELAEELGLRVLDRLPG